MNVGDLEVEVVREGKGRRLRVQGRIYAIQTDVTREDLERLSRHLAAEAATLLDNMKEA